MFYIDNIYYVKDFSVNIINANRYAIAVSNIGQFYLFFSYTDR